MSPCLKQILLYIPRNVLTFPPFRFIIELQYKIVPQFNFLFGYIRRTTMNEEKNIPNQTLTSKENAAQVIKFVLFSASAGIIQAITFALMHELTSLPYTPCYLTALTLSVLWNFTLNREFTFKSANNVPVAMLKVAAFYCVFTPLSTWWGNALTNIGWNEYAVLAVTMAANLTSEFLYDRFFVYRGSLNTNKRARKKAGEEL